MEIYYVKPIRNSRRAPATGPPEVRQYLRMVACAILLFGAGFWLAWHRFQGVQEGYRLELLQQEKQEILEANRKLRLEEAALGDPMRVEAIARNELGMMTLSPHQIFPGVETPAMAETPVLAQTRRPAGPLPTQANKIALAVP
ncbi:MAG: cell division protein FtsL [Acidobacteria bacterium]|nr:cell division protein FtsL [Acidobacteriota bacterium]